MGPASVQCFTSVRLQLEASPKAISRRTSYLRVRLEFLRYPHLITTFFNTCVFGPPKPFTAPSTWTWIGHPVSGLLILTIRPVQTWFPFGSVASDHLTSLALVTRRTVLQKVRHQALSPLTVCKHKVSGSLSLPSRGPFHLSFTVLCSIGHWVVFSLGGWSPRLPTRFHVSRGTLDPARHFTISPTGLSPSMVGFPKTIRLSIHDAKCSPQPRRTRSFGLASFPFARRY